MDSRAAHQHPTGNELRHLLGPVGVDEFVSEYAGKQALLIKGQPDKFAHLDMDEERFLEAAERFPAEYERLKTMLNVVGETEQYMHIGPEQLRPLYRAGMTVCCTALSDAIPQLAAFAEGIRLALGVPDMRFNSYLSPHGSGFDVHYDAQPIFLVQLQGAKHWWYAREPVRPIPTALSSAWDCKPERDELEYCLLETGDVLYLPAFTWHHAQAEGASLGITLGPKGLHNQPLVMALNDWHFGRGWPKDQLMPMLDPAKVPGAEVPDTAREYLQHLLHELRGFAQDLTVDDLWVYWRNEVNTPKGPLLAPGALHPVAPDESLTRDRRLLATCSYISELGEPVLRIQTAGHQISLSPQHEPLVVWLLDTREPFTARDAATAAGVEEQLRWSEVEFLLQMFLALGILRPTEA
ncbi:JmjC domain-containing protein [Halomonas daqiaonensis]|uniref:Cupin superfamily protein n=1 Tax=Halomonas daqiaonensis TaxID=650850 RepID=A0A1H7Q4H3_9GAMM|nr:cupin domain-containing protein [Halomonas daqiaonensis]SEL42903.1 Cupin superfamily protein [Halomonas daqiaonensis]